MSSSSYEIGPGLFTKPDESAQQDSRGPEQKQGQNVLEVRLHSVSELAGRTLFGFDPVTLQLMENALFTELHGTDKFTKKVSDAEK